MSTPHDPGQDPADGHTPQDPNDPQNPYGTPPPPPTTPPSAAPGTPIPSPPSPYGEPAQPPYGEPAAPAYGQPAYGQPAYGQPAQPAYGQPGQPGYPQYGAPVPSDEPGKGMAITALVLAILGCTCISVLVAIPLAIVVLVRSRDGRNRGKGMAIAALVISALYVIGWVVGGAALYNYAKDFKGVNDLKAGDCITADGLTDANAKNVTNIKSVSCSANHDGEVLVTVELTQEQADNYDTTPFAQICDPAIQSAGKSGLIGGAVTYTALTVADPQAGDHAACVAYNADGSKLTSKLGT